VEVGSVDPSEALAKGEPVEEGDRGLTSDFVSGGRLKKSVASAREG
jgi:hypothetical protein